MTTTTREPTASERALAAIPDDDTEMVVREVTAVAELNRSELETQLDAAHRHPRSTKRFLQKAISLATMTQEIAESCIYTLPRGKKPIVGPSVRLAEICAATYGNLHIGARPLEVLDMEVVSQGVAWDLETNYRVTIEAKRRITGKDGCRYNEDMVQVTHSAATAIAFRNAVFKVIPRSQIDFVYDEVRRVAVGDAESLADRRVRLMERLAKMGIGADRVLAVISKAAVEDIGLEDVERLIGLGTAVKNGDATIGEAFPATSTTPAAAAEPGTKEGTRAPIKRPAKVEKAKVETKTEKPAESPAEDPDAAAKKAVEPTAAEIAAREAEELAKTTSKDAPKDEEKAPWDK